MMNKEPERRIALRLILIILIGLCGCGLAACLILRVGFSELIGPPPGKGAKADLGYQVCQPVIKALGEYYKAEGTYPPQLKSLAPAYLADIPSEVNGSPIIYQTTQGSYSLEFSYTGPGVNVCTYSPESNWHCYGFY